MEKRIGKVAGCFVSALVVAGSWIGVAGAGECVSHDLSVSCYRTIQEALAAADPEEEVVVYPGTYAENIVVGTTGVRVVGQGGWPGGVVINPVDGVVVSLNASQSTLKNVTVQGGETGIVVMGAGAIIDGVQVSNCSTGISVTANGARVTDTMVRQIGGMGIEVGGADFVVRSSVVQQSGGQCIEVNGDGAVVEKSRITDCGREGVRVMGSAASILENDFQVAGSYMIYVVGPGARIQGNSLQGGRDAAIRVFSDTPIVVNNSARDCESGIDVHCDSCAGGRVEGNVASGTYNCPGFIVDAKSAGMLVRDNTSRNSSEDGFSLSGVGMVVQGNKATNNGFNGFDVYSSTDVQLIDNKANSNARDGIRIESGVTGTKVEKNRAHANGEVDFYDAGTGTILGTGSSQNSFGTVGSP